MWGGERREFFFFLVSLLVGVMTVAQQTHNSTIDPQVVAQPIIEEITPYLGLSTCEDLKSLLGVSYEQLKGTAKEPDLNNLTLVYRFGPVTEVFYLNDAVEVLQERNFNDEHDFILYLHGLTDDPYQERFDILSEAYLSNGNMVAALDAGPLLRDHYLRATTYVRFIGERLGKVLAALVQREPVTEVFYLNDAVEVLQERNFNDEHDFILYLHGLTDDPYQERFDILSEAYLSNGNMVAALDAGPLLRDHYLRATTYVRFIGERLGKVLAALVQHGQNPDRIHLIGHSLGAHIAGFTGKTFFNETGMKICRITGLDPAGPCFGKMKPDLRLKASDAEFVDVIHTDGGEYGTNDTLGHADYFPNGGSLQPSCSLNICAHERSWQLYSASVKKPQLFPSVRCNSWDDFKNDRCSDEISYMGFGAEPTIGKFYLQTSGEYPYGLGVEGLKYPLMRQSRTYMTHFYNP